ncbi:MAG: tetraacyldisaccharide 4'-kinase [Beijerinckiaceae bacterium]
MRAPAFWRQSERGLPALLLAPAGFLWGAIASRRMAQTGVEADVPVLCIGNFTAGGAGKTPTALACADILSKNGFRPAFLTRGYGGSLSSQPTPQRIDLHRHGAAEAGDEPLLLARHAPTFVCRDRAASAQAAAALGANAVIMDDGLQNPGLNKTLSIAVVDGETGIGNGLCIPAGPLRAPLAAQLRKVDGLVVIGEGEAGDAVAGRALAQAKAVFHARLQPDPEIAAQLRGRKVVAFAGIGRPEKFFATLEETGADIAEAFAFGDHQTLDAGEVETLQRAAASHGAQLVTTEKDFVRVGALFGNTPPVALPVKLVIEDEAGFCAFLLRAMTH